MKKIITFISAVILQNITTPLHAQLGIGTQKPDPSAALDITSSSQGLLPPRLTTNQRDSIKSPSEGLVIYNTTEKCLQYKNDEGWKCASGGDDDTNTGGLRAFETCPAYENVKSYSLGGYFDDDYAYGPGGGMNSNVGAGVFSRFFIGGDGNIYDAEGVVHKAFSEPSVRGSIFASIVQPAYALQDQLPDVKWKAFTYIHETNSPIPHPEVLVLLSEDERLFVYKVTSGAHRNYHYNLNAPPPPMHPIFGVHAYQQLSKKNDDLFFAYEMKAKDAKGKKAVWDKIYPVALMETHTGLNGGNRWEGTRFLAHNKNDGLWYSWGGTLGRIRNYNVGPGVGYTESFNAISPGSKNVLLREIEGKDNDERILDSLTLKPATIINDILQRHNTELVEAKNSLFSPIFNYHIPHPPVFKNLYFLTQDGVLNSYDFTTGLNYRITLPNKTKIIQMTTHARTLGDIFLLGDNGKIYSFDGDLASPSNQDQALEVSNQFTDNDLSKLKFKQIVMSRAHGSNEEHLFGVTKPDGIVWDIYSKDATKKSVNLTTEQYSNMDAVDFIRARELHGETKFIYKPKSSTVSMFYGSTGLSNSNASSSANDTNIVRSVLNQLHLNSKGELIHSGVADPKRQYSRAWLLFSCSSLF